MPRAMKNTNPPTKKAPKETKDGNGENKRDTRQRILENAEQVFLEKGFEKATIREICRRARANVAAVNYHFADKRDLYNHILEMWLEQCFDVYPLDMGAEPDMTAEERLYHYIRATLARLLLDREGADAEVLLRQARLFIRELTREQPNTEVLQKGHVDDLAYLLGIVSGIMGLPPESPEVRRAAMSVKGQCVHYFLIHLAGLDAAIADAPDHIEAAARHITEFSLGGIYRLKETQ